VFNGRIRVNPTRPTYCTTSFLDSISAHDAIPSPTEHQRRPWSSRRQVCRRSSRRRPSAGPPLLLPSPAIGRSAAAPPIAGHQQVRRRSSLCRPPAGPPPPRIPPAPAPPFSASSFPRPPIPHQIDAAVPSSQMRGMPPLVTTAVHRAFSPACACFGSTMHGLPSRLSARVACVAESVCCGAARRLGGTGHQDPTAETRSTEGHSLQRDATHGSPRRRGRWCSVICAGAASSAVDAPDGRRLPS
jgi:hypothetical protein